ncbi:membrane-anchored junction protein isoform X2 [Lepisosteus oculatus]|uniref:membrane-anchored junction protein isoform X2 n=1 Tax=Lepisosteus oculatus TaxID=7918 RepID=UPI0035F5108A
MPVRPFAYPLQETRLFQAGGRVYKFKIRHSSGQSREEIPADEHVTQELEDAVRVVLANLDSLQPFATEHFNIFPYKSQWERVSKLTFLQGSSALHAYPFVCTLYVERRPSAGTLAPAAKRPCSCSPAWDALGSPQSHEVTARQPKRRRTVPPPEGSTTQSQARSAEEPGAPPRGEGAPAQAGPSILSRREELQAVGGAEGSTSQSEVPEESLLSVGQTSGLLDYLARKLWPLSLFLTGRGR